MKKDYCDINIVLDRSGSMSALRNDVIGGINSFFEKQKEVPGEATVSLIQFDDYYEINYTGKNIKDVENLTYKTYEPRGMTALLDAIGKSINETGIRLSNMNEVDRPEKVIFIIQTDGEENASKEYTLENIKKMIKEQTEKYSWEFVFLGTNIDAFSVGSSLGFSNATTMSYKNSSDGLRDMYASVSTNLMGVRTKKKVGMSFTEEDYQKQQ